MPAHHLIDPHTREDTTPMRAPGWHQRDIAFPDRVTAVNVVAHDLLPALDAAQHDGHLQNWWFLRKSSWRLRYRADALDTAPIPDLLNKLTASGRINGWTSGIYEPETAAFGGEAAMDVAHTLFHHDSRHILIRAAQHAAPAIGQRETTVLLCSAMFRAAYLDWYEQGDVWQKVIELRPQTSTTIDSERAATLRRSMQLLMTADPCDLPIPAGDHTFNDQGGWLTAFVQAGRDLAGLAHQGRLSRGCAPCSPTTSSSMATEPQCRPRNKASSRGWRPTPSSTPTPTIHQHQSPRLLGSAQ